MDHPLNWNEEDALAVNAIRFLAADMVEKANSGHPGMPMGFSLPAHVLWSRWLTFNPDNPFWPGRDRFILSCGHGSALLYSLLHLAGYDLPMEQIKQFRQWESITPGHPEFGLTAGVETTTGPLGQGISNAVGMAMAQRYIREQLGTAEGVGFDPLDHRIWVIASDGDLMEGVSSEASSIAGHQRLGRLNVLYDDNHISIDGRTDLTFSEDVEVRYTAYGWHVTRAEGSDPELIQKALSEAASVTDRPSLIRVRTVIGEGAPTKRDTSGVHGSPLGAEENAAARKNMGWTRDPFDIPDEVYTLYSEAADRGRTAHETWLGKLETWLAEDVDRAAQYEQLVHGALPEDAFSDLPVYEVGEKLATRKAAGAVLNAIAPKVLSLFGGNADLAASTGLTVKGGGDFLPGSPGGRNVHYGIREHAMGAAAVGMALYGLKPYTGTFFTFSDYMRPSIRLASIMHLPVIFVFTHDSIGVGEDGPTHQPVEQLMSLRAMPGLTVLRPGDANETVAAFRYAVEEAAQPTLILASRQGIPVLEGTAQMGGEGVSRGGYVLLDCDGDPELILIGTGSELHLAVGAAETLAEEGVAVRVVSLPSWELFERQDAEYRESVLPGSVTARVSVEAGVTFGWERYLGDEGIAVGIDRYGASAPGGVVMEKLGFTVDAVLAAARKVLGS